MSGFANIKAAIVSIIQSNSTKVESGNVFNYEVEKPSGYPAIAVSNFDGSGAFADTMRNRRVYEFKLTCYQERTNVGIDQAESILTDVVDELISIFDSSSNFTLNNTVIFFYPIPSKWGYLQAPDIDVRVAEIILQAIVVQ